MVEEPWERRFRYWPLGVAGWLTITALCLLTHLGTLESDLVDRSQAALATAGLADDITNRQISFSGEIATLEGTVATDSIREQIGAVVADVPGVRRIDNLIEVLPVEEPAVPAEPAEPEEPAAAAERTPSVEAIAIGGNLTLSGEVPTQEIADNWVASAESRYGPGNVVDRLIVTDEVGSEPWLEGVKSLGILEDVTDGSISISDGGAVVTGTVANEGLRNAAMSSLASELPGLTIDDRLEIAAPAADEIASLDLSGINFETASAAITADSAPALEEAVRVLETFPDVEVEVGGHTDSDGSSAANQALSQARAEAVVSYLVGKGVAPERLTAVGYGETQPIADNTNPEGKAQNRRIEFTITEGA